MFGPLDEQSLTFDQPVNQSCNTRASKRAGYPIRLFSQ